MADPYAILAGATGFDWDAGNSTMSRTKDAVTPSQCEEVFFHQPLVVQADLAHSAQEARYAALGQTAGGRRLLLVFTFRASLIRVISARPMSRREREFYRHAEAEEDAEANPGA